MIGSRVRIEEVWTRNVVKVWIYDRLADGRIHVHRMVGTDKWVTEEVAENAVLPEPSLVLPRSALEALVAEASDALPPSAATDRHLTDAKETRDRLLTLIEKRGIR